MTFPTLTPSSVLAIGAHADDIDFWAFAALAEFAASGAEINRLILTDGSRGTTDTTISPEQLAAARKHEEQTAAKIGGTTNVLFGGFTDSQLNDDQTVREVVVRAIRQTQPQVVICWDPTYWYCHNFGINHPDHRASGAATLAAVYPLARDHLSFPEHLHQGLKTHHVSTVLMINPATPNHTLDATAHQEAKLDALRAHASQPGLVEFDNLRRQALGTVETFVRLDLPF